MWLSNTFIFLSKWWVLSFNALHILIFYIVIIVIFRLKLFRPEFAAQIQDIGNACTPKLSKRNKICPEECTLSHTVPELLLNVLFQSFVLSVQWLNLGCRWVAFGWSFFLLFFIYLFFSDVAFCWCWMENDRNYVNLIRNKSYKHRIKLLIKMMWIILPLLKNAVFLKKMKHSST